MYGEIGTGATYGELIPTAVPALRGLRIAQISAGYSHAAAVSETGVRAIHKPNLLSYLELLRLCHRNRNSSLGV